MVSPTASSTSARLPPTSRWMAIACATQAKSSLPIRSAISSSGVAEVPADPGLVDDAGELLRRSAPRPRGRRRRARGAGCGRPAGCWPSAAAMSSSWSANAVRRRPALRPMSSRAPIGRPPATPSRHQPKIADEQRHARRRGRATTPAAISTKSGRGVRCMPARSSATSRAAGPSRGGPSDVAAPQLVERGALAASTRRGVAAPGRRRASGRRGRRERQHHDERDADRGEHRARPRGRASARPAGRGGLPKTRGEQR